MNRFLIIQIILLATLALSATANNEPLYIRLDVESGMAFDDTWTLTINPNGNTTSRRVFSGSTTNFLLSTQQLDDLRSLVQSNGVLRMGESYGEHIVDACTRTLTIRIGQTQKIIHILGLQNWQLPDYPEHMRLPEVIPALVVWDRIEDWLQEEHIIRFSKWDKDIIKENISPSRSSAP